jgi:hypothetical protein
MVTGTKIKLKRGTAQNTGRHRGGKNLLEIEKERLPEEETDTSSICP